MSNDKDEPTKNNNKKTYGNRKNYEEWNVPNTEQSHMSCLFIGLRREIMHCELSTITLCMRVLFHFFLFEFSFFGSKAMV